MKEKKEKVTEKVTKVNMSKKEVKDDIIKVNLDKPIETKEEQVVEETPAVEEKVLVDVKEEQEEIKKEEVEQEQAPVLEEITEEEVKDQTTDLTEDLIDAKVEEAETGKAIPENLQKVVDFMEETGGTLEDYVSLNKDYTSYDDMTVLREYYKKTKSHLTPDEIEFLIDDSFSFDEEIEDERDIKKKKIALKEQVASAKSHLDGQKSKYYEEIKAGSKLTPDQQKAMDFFDRYNKDNKESQKLQQQQTNTFKMKTQEVFNEKFKGFNYNVGDKQYRFNINNADEVKETQGDINNFVKKFLNKNNEMSDAKGYHKSLFTAMNADKVASHFYEQGKVDALKNSVAKAKNVNMDPRQSFKNENTSGSFKARVLTEDTPVKFGFKKTK